MATPEPNRPNLKICIENTDDLSEDETSSSSSEGSDSGEDNDSKRAEPVSGSGKEEESGTGSSDSGPESHSESSSDSEAPLNVPAIEETKKILEPRKYENKTGDFVTGFNPLSEESTTRKAKRAERFGIKKDEEADVISSDLQALYKSLGMSEEVIESGEQGYRLEAIHLRGIENLSTQDIFKYFQNYSPGSIEWIDDNSCNVVWFDPMTTARAMLNMSHDPSAKKSKSKEKKKVDDGEKTETAPSASKEETMEAEEYDDDLNLMSSDDEQAVPGEKTKSPAPAPKSPEAAPQKPPEDVEMEDGEIEEDGDAASNKSEVDFPPGKWRRGVNMSDKARKLFFRYATKADKKQPGAEKKSIYYRKHGNPNFGGMRGLISGTTKRRFMAHKYNDVVQEARLAIQKSRKLGDDYDPEETSFDDELHAAVQRHRPTADQDTSFGAQKRWNDIIEAKRSKNKKIQLKEDSIEEEDEEEEEEEEEDILVAEDDDDQLDDDFIEADMEPQEERPTIMPKFVKVMSGVKRRLGNTDSESEESDDEYHVSKSELQNLLRSPAKKRTMRMYADDEENKAAESVPRISSQDVVNDARDWIKSRRHERSHEVKSSSLASRLGRSNESSSHQQRSDLRGRLGSRQHTQHTQHTQKHPMQRLTIEVQPD